MPIEDGEQECGTLTGLAAAAMLTVLAWVLRRTT
jgi:hypothetical protein